MKSKVIQLECKLRIRFTRLRAKTLLLTMENSFKFRSRPLPLKLDKKLSWRTWIENWMHRLSIWKSRLQTSKINTNSWNRRMNVFKRNLSLRISSLPRLNQKSKGKTLNRIAKKRLKASQTNLKLPNTRLNLNQLTNVRQNRLRA